MTPDQVSEFVIYLYRGSKNQMTYLISRVYGMEYKEARSWCKRHAFPEMEAIQDMKSKLSKSKKYE